MDRETAKEMLEWFETCVEFQIDNDCGPQDIVENLQRDIKHKRQELNIR